MFQGLVYVIDDEEDICDIIEHNVGSFGIDVKAFQNPEKALGSIEEDQPVAIIVDYNMPEINGLEFCDKLSEKSLESKPKIILLTSWLDSDVVPTLALKGVNLRLSKPEDISDLAQRLFQLVTESSEDQAS